MSDELATGLDALADLAAKGVTMGGIGGVALGIGAVALKAGAAMARAGKDPLIEITRMLSAKPGAANAYAEAEALVAKLWPDQLSPTSSDASLAVAATDPYEDPDDGKEEEQPP